MGKNKKLETFVEFNKENSNQQNDDSYTEKLFTILRILFFLIPRAPISLIQVLFIL